MRKKVLVIGPIGDFGGRELEAGFIAKSLKSDFKISICSTGELTKKSQVFGFVKNDEVYTIKKLTFKNSFILKITSFISFVKNKGKLPMCYFVNNEINKKYFNADEKIKNQIENIISKHDLIIICAQLSSNYIEEIINYSSLKNKPVFFRTTGAIKKNIYTNFDCLKKVTLFIHHSEANAANLNSQMFLPYVVIDQCAYNEEKLLKINHINTKVRTFVTISRLVKEKNLDVLINAFNQISNNLTKLYIIGDGPEIINLKQIANDNKAIIFTGFTPHDELDKFLKISDSLIVSHYDEETGPLTGIEAMASSRLIISSKTGAMMERLPHNPFWFDNNENSLLKQINKVCALDENEIIQLSQENRARYLSNYSIDKISKQYLELVKNSLCE
jgi:glycosyltransferase involved in cell wall biosynthesis